MMVDICTFVSVKIQAAATINGNNAIKRLLKLIIRKYAE